MDDASQPMEETLAVIRSVQIYKLPPRPPGGYMCDAWKENEVWSGRLRVVAVGDSCFIRFEDVETGQVFAVCPYRNPGCVESVRDSSRFFVIRIEAGNGHAFIGIGFQERAWSFDFNLALQTFTRNKNARAAPEGSLIQTPKTNLKLAEGEKLQINLSVPSPAAVAPGKKKAASVLGALPHPPRAAGSITSGLTGHAPLPSAGAAPAAASPIFEPCSVDLSKPLSGVGRHAAVAAQLAHAPHTPAPTPSPAAPAPASAAPTVAPSLSDLIDSGPALKPLSTDFASLSLGSQTTTSSTLFDMFMPPASTTSTSTTKSPFPAFATVNTAEFGAAPLVSDAPFVFPSNNNRPSQQHPKFPDDEWGAFQ
eukprot:gnl/Spiro4/17652_TR9390_c0_g1_i1.p1 gnl/Spiro4/17652_TR9390_c0_g1~~gnl/Spiro4/17652_TR9390_c0_g1_i1.p1  ORF type:complete len:376 (-),score=68.31 gnl/Spiro4/17652_TR9390_c0_g1_i1:19-1113(-)